MTSARPVEPATPLALWVTTVILAVLVGGVPGALIVLTALIETQAGRRRAPAAAALGLLALAALATVWGPPLIPGSVNLDYALDRPVAGAAGRLAGVAMLVALAVATVAERVPVLVTAPPVPSSRHAWPGVLRGCADRRSRGPSGPPAKPARAGSTASVSAAEPPSFERVRLSAHALRDRVRYRNGKVALANVASAARVGLPYLIPVVVVVGTVSLWGPAPLNPQEVRLAQNIEMGQGYLPAEVAPLGPVVAVAAPVNAEVALLVVSVLTVVAAVRLVCRLGVGSGVAAGAGVLVAVVTGAGGQGLAEALTTLLITIGLVWVWPTRISKGRAAIAGLCLGGAVLARPLALLVVVAAVVWLIADLDDWRRVTVPAALVGSSLVALWPWLRWLHLNGNLGWSILAADLKGGAGWAAPVLAVVAVVLVIKAVAYRTPPRGHSPG